MGLLTEWLVKKGTITQRVQFVIIILLDIVLFGIVIWAIYQNSMNAQACQSWCALKFCPIPHTSYELTVNEDMLNDEELECWRYIKINKMVYEDPADNFNQNTGMNIPITVNVTNKTI